MGGGQQISCKHILEKMFILEIQNKMNHNIKGFPEVRNEDRPPLAACKMNEYFIGPAVASKRGGGNTDSCFEKSETVFHVGIDHCPNITGMRAKCDRPRACNMSIQTPHRTCLVSFSTVNALAVSNLGLSRCRVDLQ